MKQETLEEAAEIIYLSYENNELLYGHSKDLQLAYKAGIVDGVKWQQEKMYSEEDVLKLWNWLNDGFIIRKSLPTREELIGWFEQFKDK